ncbi:MAG TPA: ABC transporter substrate-binding protein [Rubrobacter sp.]|nr:ABC transporter substrate-binding protein [Rubrobacter sp.]
MGRATRVFAAVLVLAVAPILTACGGKGGEGSEERVSDEVSRIGFSEETTGPGGVGTPTITVATDVSYPPFAFSPRGGPRGLDIDLMDEIAERGGFRVEYRDARFDFITRGLVEGLYDASISAMTITGTREQQADFSDPYYNVDEALVVRSGSEIESTGDLEEKTLGVQRGTVGQEQAGELLNSGDVAAVRTFRTVDGAFAALRGGLLDGVIYDLPAAQREVEESGGALELVEVIPTGSQYGIAFPKESPLIEPVNEALAEIKEDGTYEEIYEKWIGRPPEEIP